MANPLARDARFPDPSVTAVSSSSSRLDAGTGTRNHFIQVANDEDRARAVLRAAAGARDITLIVTGSPQTLNAAWRSGVAPDLKLLVLSTSLENAELSLRLTEIEARIYRAIAVDPARLWHAGIITSLRLCGPQHVVIDAGRAGVTSLEALLSVERQYRRVRHIFSNVPVVLATGQLALESTRAAAALLQTEAVTAQPLLPTTAALRVRFVRDEHERLAVLSAAAGVGAPGLVLAPSRGKAAAIAAHLSRRGHEAVAYHGGQSASERSAILAAHRSGRQHVVVATEALALVEGLPAPRVVAFTHPPRSLQLLTRFAAQIDAGPAEVPVVLAYSSADIPDLHAQALAGLPALGHLRRVYRALRGAAAGKHVLVHPGDLAGTIGGDFAGQPGLVRMCLDLLEQYGYIVRCDDLARAATVTLLAPYDSIGDLAGLIPPRPGIPVPLDPMQVAAKLGWDPEILQQRLLAAERRGLLSFRPVGREALYTLSDPPRSAGDALASRVRGESEAALRSAQDVSAYLRATDCRIQLLHQAFGLPMPAPCGRCDRCNPPARSRTRQEPRLAREYLVALSALAGVPFDVPRRGAHRIVRAALRAAGLPADRAAVGDALDALLARDLVVVREGALGEVLAVGEHGLAALA